MSAPFDLTVTSELWEPADAWRKCLVRAFDACALDAGIDWPGREISVLLCDDAAIRSLNRDWRQQDKATNVLSFPAVTSPVASPDMLRDMPLGDIAIAYETSAKEARADGKRFEHHVMHLAIHGALHLLDFDHETEEDAERMEAVERHILAGLGIADPYRDNEPAKAATEVSP